MSIERYEDRAGTGLATYQDEAVQRLSTWAHAAGAAHNVAETLVQTSFCPDAFRGKAGEATAAILAGMEVGLQPMAALRSFDVIQGQAAPRALTLRAVVQAQGHEIEMVESNATRCRMRGRRKGSSDWQTVTWTIERAKQLGVTGKSNWRSQPQAMLVARATSELARLIASDAILGIGYSSEEVADGGTLEQRVGEVTTTPAAEGSTRRMSRRGAAAPIEDPPINEPVDADLVDESPLLDTKSDLAKAMYATIHDAGIPDEERISTVGEIIGRELTSTKEMTDAEARHVIDHLKALLAPADTAGDPA